MAGRPRATHVGTAALLERCPSMTVFALAQLSIHDHEGYDRYVARFMDVLAPYRGRLLAADDAPTVIEGSWPHEKVVLLEFPDQAELERWSTSPEYVEIAQDRVASTTGCVLMVRGVGP